jgi:hypothetical protein
MKNTEKQYQTELNKCREIFHNKTKDYGTSWRILRPSSLTDQLFIKGKRIRSIEEKNGHQKVGESIESEYIGLVNYSIISLIQLEYKGSELELPEYITLSLYEKYSNIAKELMIKKNHDYDEVWRDMRISSLTDLILMKLLRIKQIEDNKGVTVISEGLDANYLDIINYSLFALIRLNE